MDRVIWKQHGKWLPADVHTPISLFLGLVGGDPGILLESAEVDGRLGRYSLIAWDFRLRLGCRGGKLSVLASDERLKGLQELEGLDFLDGLRRAMAAIQVVPPDGFEGLPAITRGIYGYFGYGLAGIFEPKLADHLPPQKAETELVLPGKVVLYDHLHARCCYLSSEPGSEIYLRQSFSAEGPQTPWGGELTTTPGKDEYMSAVARAKDLITNGEAIQVVLSTRFSAPFSGDPFTLYRRMRGVNPSPYMFFIRLPEMTLMGSSPELMVRCRDSALEVRPIAGTRPRGADVEQDEGLAEELINDPKERAEHVMLVDLGRNDLGRIAKPGTVKVEKFMQIERFSHVMHMTSYVEADLKDGLDALDVLAATFPAGTVSGAPKIRAMEIIAELEGLNRGPYAGAIGWIGLNKGSVNLDTGITIRSMWIKDGQAHFQAGAGIVFDSDPEREWTECQNKARFLREVLAGERRP